ncbi:substrate-binding domain-containing protein [Maridesulfovibrio bastinii]|uniref:substrate-binding domain-containing protein n=1 Tax=Maridesulfovibrio bastinii TaxID=47157 RepID=UPI00040A9608|nr:substrate-binding domain-containing protein [Maridesulfovibrio bastinii]
MPKKVSEMNRRSFIKGGTLALAGFAASASPVKADPAQQSLQVWSCGGLAEAFIPANEAFEKKTGKHIAYTGAFAAALGKSLLGSAETEVFAPRVLALAKKLKAQGKMLSFQPLCFTKYVLITPAGNPKNIKSIEDLKRPDVVCQLSPESSPPGGKAVMGVLKKSGVIKEAKQNAGMLGSCVQHDVAAVASGQYDASVVEQRITRLPRYLNKFEVIDIPEEFFPAAPIPFSIGVMKFAKDKDLAHDFIDFVCGEIGQACFENAGFIHARSEEGQRLVKKYGVYDV